MTLSYEAVTIMGTLAVHVMTCLLLGWLSGQSLTKWPSLPHLKQPLSLMAFMEQLDLVDFS